VFSFCEVGLCAGACGQEKAGWAARPNPQFKRRNVEADLEFDAETELNPPAAGSPVRRDELSGDHPKRARVVKV